MSFLNNGDIFPSLSLQTVGGKTISLPTDLAGEFGVVLIYRGSWCPVCNHQLSDFVTNKIAIDALRVTVVAISVDDEATSTDFVAKLNLDFILGYGVSADEIAAATGAFTNDSPRFLQPAGFILAPNGVVLNAVYATNAVGRLMAQEVIGFVDYMKSHHASE